MSLFLATLLPGLFLALLGALLLWPNSLVGSTAKALPRSNRGAWLFFGAGTAWFLWRLSHLNESDLIFFKTPGPVMIGFGVLAVLAFIYTPDFLAVRGLCVLVLLSASPLLEAAFMEYQHPQRLFMVTLVYVFIAFAIWLGASPFRLRDFFGWLFARPTRSRAFGGALAAYGLLLSVVAFTY